MNPVSLKELEALENAATPGPWEQKPEVVAGRIWARRRTWFGLAHIEPLFDFQLGDDRQEAYAQREADCTLTVAARNAVKPLIEAYRVLARGHELNRLSADPMDRRKFVKDAGIEHADSDGISQAALARAKELVEL